MRLLLAVTDPVAGAALGERIAAGLGAAVDAETVTDLPALRARLARPDAGEVVVVDLTLPGLAAFDGIAALHLDRPQARLVVISRIVDPHIEVEVARAGARALLPYDAPAALAGQIARIVAEGGSYMSVHALLAVGDEIARASHALVLGSMTSPEETLTDREARILAHIRQGATNRAIGDAIGIDENRVKIHVRSIFRKIGARNRTEAALKAAEILSLHEQAPARA